LSIVDSRIVHPPAPSPYHFQRIYRALPLFPSPPSEKPAFQLRPQILYNQTLANKFFRAGDQRDAESEKCHRRVKSPRRKKVNPKSADGIGEGFRRGARNASSMAESTTDPVHDLDRNNRPGNRPEMTWKIDFKS
jgi:hypothetical protein